MTASVPLRMAMGEDTQELQARAGWQEVKNRQDHFGYNYLHIHYKRQPHAA